MAGRQVTKPTLTGNAEVRDPLRSQRNLVVRYGQVIVAMDNTKKQSGFIAQGQAIKRRKIASVTGVSGYWNMYPVDGAANHAGYAVGEIHDPVEIRWQGKVVELKIAETEVQP